jgi:hypothetical protein
MHPDGVEPLVEPLEFEPAPAAAEAPPLPAAEAPLCPHRRARLEAARSRPGTAAM